MKNALLEIRGKYWYVELKLRTNTSRTSRKVSPRSHYHRVLVRNIFLAQADTRLIIYVVDPLFQQHWHSKFGNLTWAICSRCPIIADWYQSGKHQAIWSWTPLWLWSMLKILLVTRTVVPQLGCKLLVLQTLYIAETDPVICRVILTSSWLHVFSSRKQETFWTKCFFHRTNTSMYPNGSSISS